MSATKTWLFLLNLIISIQLSSGATILTEVPAYGYDASGNSLSGSVVDGLNVYDASGNFLGIWQVNDNQTYTAFQNQNNRNERSTIGFSTNSKTGNNNGADDHAATFSSFNASSDSSDHIVINNESLDISVQWRFHDMGFQRRDMDAGETYTLGWTMDSFFAGNVDLGSVTGMVGLTSVGTGTTFGYDNYLDNTNAEANVFQAVTPINFNGTEPEATISYNGSAAGQLTDKYDGSDFNLQLGTTQTRTTNAVPGWSETLNGDGDGNAGENPRGYIRAYLDADFDYELQYTTYTFIPVPEPRATTFITLFAFLLIGRRRR